MFSGWAVPDESSAGSAHCSDSAVDWRFIDPIATVKMGVVAWLILESPDFLKEVLKHPLGLSLDDK